MFTDNNYEGLLDWDSFEAQGASYMVYQEEVGENGTAHLQGFLYFAQPRSLGQVSALFDHSNPHLEVVRNIPQAIAYCQKDESRIGGPYNFGLAPAQGARSDLAAVKESLDAGRTNVQLWDDHFSQMSRYHKSFEVYKRVKATKRDWAMEIIIYIGPSGTGKTRAVRETYPDAYWKAPGKWWDNYQGENDVVIDEMYGHQFAYTDLLRLLDRYPYSVECKGATMEFVSHRIILTSNQEPEDWYDAEKTHRMSWEESPLYRRLHEFGRTIRTGEVHRRVRPRLEQPEAYGIVPEQRVD